jgi:lipopolysaccharide/colanic/teichoic acid biosynthesis glycosyltransferase
MTNRYAWVRRVTDTLVVIVALPIALPLLVATIVAIQLSSPGPVLFRQRRGGYRNEEFTMVKLRTMPLESRCRLSDGTEALTAEDDARTTATARWIRRHRLDELPQLWHVLTGEMALIGPRPVPAGVSRRMNATDPQYARRTIVRPGLTGLAQVRLGYTDNMEGEKQKLEYDLTYIDGMSPALDLRIIAATVRTVVRGTGGR